MKGSAGYSEIVKDVDQSGPANNTIEVSWKLCSAYAHGDMWSTLGASQRTPIPDTDTRPGVGAFKIEANVSLSYARDSARGEHHQARLAVVRPAVPVPVLTRPAESTIRPRHRKPRRG
jgi:hypothetical protein